jgi:hypothetical protein
MEPVEFAPQVLPNRRGVKFTLTHRSRTVDCVVALAALETYFWLETSAGDARILRTFETGYARIRAIAERKLRAHPTTDVQLTPEDFARP